MGVASDEERPAGNGRRCHQLAVELVGRQDLVFFSGGQDVAHALAAAGINPSADFDGGCTVVATEAFLPMDLSSQGIETAGDALIIHGVDLLADKQGGGDMPYAAGVLPDDLFIRQLAFTGANGVDGEVVLAYRADDVKQAIAVGGAAYLREAGIGHPPELLACPEVVGPDMIRAGADQLRDSVYGLGQGSRVRHLPYRARDSFEVLSSLLPPDLAGTLVEGGYVLYVDAVAGENQQVLMKDRRASGSLDDVEIQFSILPDNFSRGVEAYRAARPEGDVGMLAVQDRRWGGVAVLDVKWTRIRGRQDLDVEEKLAAGAVDADGVKGEPLLLRAGHPDLASRDHRRGPALAWDRGFPDDVFRFTPGERDPLRIRVPLSIRTAELRPVCQQAGRAEKRNQEEKAGSHDGPRLGAGVVQYNQSGYASGSILAPEMSSSHPFLVRGHGFE
mgnify:CR=1 FL=1